MGVRIGEEGDPVAMERVARKYTARDSAMQKRRVRILSEGGSEVAPKHPHSQGPEEEAGMSQTALNLEGLIGVVVRRLDDESLGEVVGGYVEDQALMLIVATRGSASASPERPVLRNWRYDEVSV